MVTFCRKTLQHDDLHMLVNLQFKYNGKDIEIVKDFNYLGIYFSRSGSF